MPTHHISICNRSGLGSVAAVGTGLTAWPLPLQSSQCGNTPNKPPVEASSLYCTFKVVQLKTNTADISNKINTRTKSFYTYFHLWSIYSSPVPSLNCWLKWGRETGFCFWQFGDFLVIHVQERQRSKPHNRWRVLADTRVLTCWLRWIDA